MIPNNHRNTFSKKINYLPFKPPSDLLSSTGRSLMTREQTIDKILKLLVFNSFTSTFSVISKKKVETIVVYCTVIHYIVYIIYTLYSILYMILWFWNQPVRKRLKEILPVHCSHIVHEMCKKTIGLIFSTDYNDFTV